MTPVHRERPAVGLPGRFPGIGFLVIHRDGILRQTPDHAAVLDVDTRHAVAGGSHDERVVEADIQGPRRDVAVPIGTILFGTESKMPFSHDAGMVSGLSEEGWQCGPARFDDQCRIAG